MAEEKLEKKKKKPELLTKANKKGQHINKMLVFLRILIIPIYWLILPFRFIGTKKRTPDGAYIYVCNHYRIWDIIFPFASTWESVHFLAKASLMKNAFLRFILEHAGVISVNRDGNDLRAIMEAMKCLKNNEKIAIFPEGTRNKTDAEMLPFKSGAAMLSIKTHTPVIPIMQVAKSKPFRLNPILVGEPVEFTEYYDKKLSQEDYEEADRKLMSILLEMRRNYLASKGKK